MRRNIYTIYDRTARDLTIQSVLPMHNHHAIAMREFTDAVLAPNSKLALHPEDYQLLYLGTIDTTDGVVLERLDEPQLLVTAAQVITEANKGA